MIFIFGFDLSPNGELVEEIKYCVFQDLQISQSFVGCGMI
jgi:hypothetical protein